MKLGVAGLLGDGSPDAVRRVRALGFTAASWMPASLDMVRDTAALDAVRDALAREDMELCQLLPPQYPSLVHPDAAVRAAGIEAMTEVLRAGVRLGAGNVYVRPGSLNARGPWTPHPDNHLAETRTRLVESLRALCTRAEEIGIRVAVEGHAVSPLDTPEVVRDVADRVGSAALGFNADPVNFVRNLDQAYRNSDLIRELFDLLGPITLCGHAKDVTTEDRLVVHVAECVPGQGYLDHELFLQRFAACCPGGVVLIEHLPAERVPEARRALLEFADRAGVSFQEG